jgi:hypothetical protein
VPSSIPLDYHPTFLELKGTTMSQTATANGKPTRKQLSDQLDRLDSIIDALAEGLQGAVTDACREGARQAVRDAIIEVLTNPELRALIAPATPIPTATPVPEPKKPSLWTRLKAKLAAARNAAINAVENVNAAIRRRFDAAAKTVATLSQVAGQSFPYRRILLVGLGVGSVVGVACLVMPQMTSAIVSGIGATCGAISVQVGNWLTRTTRRLGLVT